MVLVDFDTICKQRGAHRKPRVSVDWLKRTLHQQKLNLLAVDSSSPDLYAKHSFVANKPVASSRDEGGDIFRIFGEFG
ncbi:hypothetical protein A7N05_19100 [Acinetobacter baumannii]|nr:hypothetical protein A7N05_19100 [Acinetobacter baumannii]